MTRTGRNSTAVAALALAAGALAGPALAGGPAKLKSMSFTTQEIYNQTIHVVSTDGKKWNKIKQGSIQFGAHIFIEAKRQRASSATAIKSVGIVLGGCSGETCYAKPLLWSASPSKREYRSQMAVTLPTSQIPVSSSSGVATIPFGDTIISKCNNKLSADGPTKKHSFKFLTPVTFAAHSYIGTLDTEGLGDPSDKYWKTTTDHAVTKQIVVTVQCDPVPPRVPTPMKISSMQFKHSVYKPDGKCPAEVTLRATFVTTKPGDIRFTLYRGDGARRNIKVTAKKQSAGHYGSWIQKYTFSKSESRKYMIVVKGHPLSSHWEHINIDCGLVNDGVAEDDFKNPARPDMPPPIKPLKVTGQLTLADKAGAPKDKPRLGAAVFKLWATQPGSTSYRMTCSGGRQWTGTLNTFKVAEKKYQAVGQHNFQIAKTELLGCALRSTSAKGNPVVALASKQFELIRRNPQIGEGPQDVKDPGRPSSERPTTERPNKLKDKRERLRKLAEQRRKRAEAKKEADRRRKAAEKRRKREAAKKAAELLRKRAAAKKAAELRRKRAAAKKAAELRRKRLQAKKAAELRRKRLQARKAAELRRKRLAAKRAAELRRRQQVLRAKQRAMRARRQTQ